MGELSVQTIIVKRLKSGVNKESWKITIVMPEDLNMDAHIAETFLIIHKMTGD